VRRSVLFPDFRGLRIFFLLPEVYLKKAVIAYVVVINYVFINVLSRRREVSLC
jgi:hypothetical protein